MASEGKNNILISEALPGTWLYSHSFTTLHHSLIYELISSVPTLVTTISILATSYSLTASGFNLKNFLDSAVVTIDNVKGNELFPPSVFSFNLRKFMPMEEDEYAHLLEYYKTAYNNTSLKSYRQAVFAMFHENNGHEMSAFTGQIQYLFVSDIINLVTYQADRHVFAYVR
ncbi:hypothetical protein PHYBLDRAFT_151167 [Phycomyces blakesleeanus NRRL 1555(-)]|uniref:Uncharacterized protein n=1 Tax=Phycomyces blakesleeanus (strain ATCC 8743b / DSM 1359 / FGSC 10004 / NBRC 33097 / NRRL 1555) TaxID=763407 RepID=A0A162ZLM5_PHYB8|nr:hypothetical protein PHYBLDRAFT_151167 [Phycomyces blakesleeanus NRRL 1555(-)]OAD67651.1 hypothetical protein PHYBLDRAFT_151167 [Phycomyces blakesleeanus NRRL 1555(-)]|eukprot:XP_018285691.1 hypothetical protein PHYBLDRAFT_151167 [Phycomyces blakesleeanus NRRL 1555(-)]